ncbi:DUF2690 domain-containing protein [Micromonospora mirobrigensis]|nr:DUF2690 domain-containing protein [Micromonospora mirobrigensis]
MSTENSTYLSETTLVTTGCGSACDYKDPASYKIYYSGCSTCYHYCADDAITPTPTTSYDIRNSGASIQLRYSPRCRTAWARTTYYDYAYIKVESRYSNGTTRAVAGVDKWQGASPWTAMLNDAGLQARACMANQGPMSGYTCTSWY